MGKKCDICNSSNFITRHHVLPRMYMKFLTPELRIKTVSLCRTCHNQYEQSALPLKKKIAIELEELFDDQAMDSCLEPKRAAKMLHTPASKINLTIQKTQYLLGVVERYLGRDSFPEDWVEITQIESKEFLPFGYLNHGQRVLLKVDIQQFIQRWLSHFEAFKVRKQTDTEEKRRKRGEARRRKKLRQRERKLAEQALAAQLIELVLLQPA